MKKIWGVGKIFVFLLLLLAVMVVVSYLAPDHSFKVALILTTFGVAMTAVSLLGLHTNIGRIISGVSKGISTAQSRALNELKVPVMIATEHGEIVWYNPSFEEKIPDASQLVGKNVDKALGLGFRNELRDGKTEIILGDKIFSVTDSNVDGEGTTLKIYYLFDITELRTVANEYVETRPVVAIVALDNIDEIMKNAKDSEIASFRSEVQKKIEGYVSHVSSICRKLSGDRYIMVMEERHFKVLSEQGINILDRVREIKFGDSNATLSIGIGLGGADFLECSEMANQALEMALGRGGDQAVVKLPNNEYRFYGGVAGAIEKHNKVRARIIANSLKGLISSSSNVVLMGHRFSDLDALGSCIALSAAAKALGKNAYIVLDRNKTMAEPLCKRAEMLESDCNILSGEEVLPLVDKETLLIIVDVHRPSFLDCPEIYNQCVNVVVIDHHRKAVDYINDAVLFYHETAVSSTCEMVTELMQYICPKAIGQLEAEALLSGIMLDSRNFVLNTGVRTFEASAILRNRGADPVTVKKLFAGSMDAYKLRAEIVGSAVLYDEDCAIAINETANAYSRVASSQAADELLGISGVLGSFVLCKYGSEVNISARSLGGMNVQIIMEKLGGGGHRTMAACQLSVDSFKDAVEKLKVAIDEYKRELRRKG